MVPERRVRIANVSGFYGDRVSAATEVLARADVDVVTGDWLAELTMWLLARNRTKGRPGYARTFLTQLEDVLPRCVERGIKIVSNAGGVDPLGLADEVAALGQRLGCQPTIAVVNGDDLVPRFADLSTAEAWLNLDTGEPLNTRLTPVSANAYLGAFGISDALSKGADVVITGRVTDASLVVGPCVWFHQWSRDALDQLAGATVAGHLIECGMQATGGNFAFFSQVPNMSDVGFPIAEVASDGSCTITKPPGTGGLVNRSTVTAQLLYEVDSPRYLGPDVITRFDTVRLEQVGEDAVRVAGAVGESPPDRLKVAVNVVDGFRNSVTFVLTGRDIERKAAIVETQLFDHIPGGRDAFTSVAVEVRHHRLPASEPESQWQAQSELIVAVEGDDKQLVGTTFTSAAVALTLGSVPGLFVAGAPPRAVENVLYWPTTIAAQEVPQQVRIVGSDAVASIASTSEATSGATSDTIMSDATIASSPLIAASAEPTVRAALGELVGARSGDKGGNANVGIWVDPDRRDAPEVFAWLAGFLTEQVVVQLIPEARQMAISIFRFDNVLGLNIVIRGLLGRGVASSRSIDPQAKGLGEYLRAREVEVPRRFVLQLDE